jgi:protein SHQ1
MLKTLAKEVLAARVEKSMLGWDLDELELAAMEAMDRDPDSDDEDEDEVETMTPTLL